MKSKQTTLAQLTKTIVAFRDKRNWKQFHNPKDLAMALNLEASEVLEHFLWKNQEEMEQHSKEHKKEVGDELSDVLYWVLLMAHDLDIDLAQAFADKMKQNNTKYPAEKVKNSHKKYTEY